MRVPCNSVFRSVHDAARKSTAIATLQRVKLIGMWTVSGCAMGSADLAAPPSDHSSAVKKKSPTMANMALGIHADTHAGNAAL